MTLTHRPSTTCSNVLSGEDEVEATLLTIENDWETYATDCRNLFRAYLLGSDLSERTERALYYITHLLASAHDQASFPTFCQLARQPDRLDSVLGEEGSVLSYPRCCSARSTATRRRCSI